MSTRAERLTNGVSTVARSSVKAPMLKKRFLNERQKQADRDTVSTAGTENLGTRKLTAVKGTLDFHCNVEGAQGKCRPPASPAAATTTTTPPPVTAFD